MRSIAETKKTLARNLHTILTEKSWQDLSDFALNDKFCSFYNRPNNCSDRLGKWRRGKALPSYQTLEKIADWLDCEIDDLLPEVMQENLRGYFIE